MNEMILEGRLLDAFDEFCHSEVVMRENDGPLIVGFAANRQRERDFADGVASFEELRLLASAVNSDVSFSEWTMDVTMRNGRRVRLEQVAVRRRRDEKVVSERFYYRPDR